MVETSETPSAGDQLFRDQSTTYNADQRGDMSTCARSGICLERVFFVENMVGDFGYTWGISGRSY